MHPIAKPARLLRLPLLLIAAAPAAVLAGPPFATDDPEPAPESHYEIYFFSEGTRTQEGIEGALPGFEVNYGAGPDLQLAAEFTQGYEQLSGESLQSRYGGAELGLKYRFLHEREQGWAPQVSFYPSVEIPDGGGDRHASTFLPLWLQKSVGEWEVFGGGGRRLNSGSGSRDNWFAGIAALRPVTEHLELGAEIFRETADSKEGHAGTGYNLAAMYDIDGVWHLVGSAGRGLSAVSESNEFSYYVGLELTPR